MDIELKLQYLTGREPPRIVSILVLMDIELKHF